MSGWLACWSMLGWLALPSPRPTQYIVLNLTPGLGWHDSRPASLEAAHLDELRAKLGPSHAGPVRWAAGYIFSYLNATSETVFDQSLRRCLATAEATDTPVLIQLDGENWWQARPDLWNWWDPTRPGYDPANRANVEWTGWSPSEAVKIAWRNWGRQIRVLPPPNLMSPRYREACHQQMRRIVPIILDWAGRLPAERRDLFVGLKLGWESSIGVNAWHYPGGNDLLDRDPKDDPQTGLKTDLLPSRGVATLGYAAASTAGLRTSGELTEDDQVEVVRRHLTDLCALAAELGVGRDKLFTHGVGWKANEKLYTAALNAYACPGWSFYHHAANPAGDPAVRDCLARSDSPGWAVVEWLLGGPRQTEPWRRALTGILSDARCRFVTVYNWESIRGDDSVSLAIRGILSSDQVGQPGER